MLRKTLTILSLIGLLLSVGLWIASYWHAFFGSGYLGGTLSGGGIELSYQLTRDPAYSGPEFDHWIFQEFDGWYTDWRPDGWISLDGGGWYGIYLYLPLWLPTTFCLMMCCFLYLPIHRRRKRKKLGLCVKCGYDLRASKDRCPECEELIQNRKVQPNGKDP